MEHEELVAKLEAERETEKRARAEYEAKAKEVEGDVGGDLSTLIVARETSCQAWQIAQRRRRSLEKAVERSERGTYGICLQCGKDIDPARLACLPDADLCIDCADPKRRRIGMVIIDD